MVRAKGRYRDQVLELEEPLALPDGAVVEIDIYLADEIQEFEMDSWSLLGMTRLEEVWNNPDDAVYDDWKKLYGV